MRKHCATIAAAVFLAGITGTLCVNFNTMDLPQCLDICSDRPSIIDAILFSNSTVILTFSNPRNCSAEVVSYVTTYGCSQQLGIIDPSSVSNLTTTDSSNFQRINLLIADETATSQDRECAFIVQAIIQLPNGTRCITMGSACTIFNVSFYASHQSLTSLEGNCFNLPISTCPRISDFPVFAVTFCSKIIQRPTIYSLSEVRGSKVPYLSILRDNETGSEEVCVNETYINLTTLIVRCSDPGDDATLNPSIFNMCLRLRARLWVTSSTCELTTSTADTVTVTSESESTLSGSINYMAWAISSTVLMFICVFLLVLTVFYILCYKYCHKGDTKYTVTGTK